MGSGSSTRSSESSNESDSASNDDSDNESQSSNEDGKTSGATAASASTVAPMAQIVANGRPAMTGKVIASIRSSKVCAKMLVRSRLRCSCHFIYTQECPKLVQA